jgi:hypothetical protein
VHTGADVTVIGKRRSTSAFKNATAFPNVCGNYC